MPPRQPQIFVGLKAYLAPDHDMATVGFVVRAPGCGFNAAGGSWRLPAIRSLRDINLFPSEPGAANPVYTPTLVNLTGIALTLRLLRLHLVFGQPCDVTHIYNDNICALELAIAPPDRQSAERWPHLTQMARMANSEIAALRARQTETRLSVPFRGSSSDIICSANEEAWSYRRDFEDFPVDIQLVLTSCAVIAGGLDYQSRV